MTAERQQNELRNLSICSKCNRVAPARHEEREGKVYLVKECPQCGITESLVSSNAARWYERRGLCNYDGKVPSPCSLLCTQCKHGKTPTLVFLDVTNRCNMNCPICLANIPKMGFTFDPPMRYFEKMFKALGQLNPRPKIQLFGGEPTVRNDLIELIHLAASYGLSARVVTNGIRLADEEYCRKLLATGTQLMFAFDGPNPEAYRKIRNHPEACAQKLKALENVRKYRKSKITIMCCAGLGVNDHDLGEVIRICHEGRDYIAALDLIPLAETWGPQAVEAGNTTIDDVEKMVREALPNVEFIPSGMLYQLPTFLQTFDIGRLTFGGAHPNCESVTILVSDGKAYHAPSRYLRKSFMEVAREATALDREMGARLSRSVAAKMFGRRGRQLVVGWALLRFLRRNVNFSEVFGGHTTSGLTRIVWGLLRRQKPKDLLRRYTQCHGILRVIILPFEEPANVENSRLVECPACFAYEHPVTGEIQLMPVCAWSVYKDDILRQTARRYGVESRA